MQLSEILLLILVLFGSFVITFFYKKWAIRRSILDIPNERSSHKTPVPRGGGIAIVIAFYTYMLYSYLSGQIEESLFFALLPGIVLAFIGIVDDFRSISPLMRISVQFVCAGIALYFLSGFNGLFVIYSKVFWTVIMLFGIVWYINLFNFLDGSDGYASMEAMFLSISLWIFSGLDILLILCFSIGGFLFWNWPKARIFMGDVGSTVLGFVLVVFGVYLHNEGMLALPYWIILSALFWFDASITLIRRIGNHQKLSKAHKKHIYQRAIQGGFSHLKTMLSGFVINIFLFFICYLVWKGIISLLMACSIGIIILIAVMIYVEKKYAFNS